MTRRSVVFWNVQRLFGSGGSPIEHALTQGAARASATKAQVRDKIKTIAAVLARIAEISGPLALVGLAEIENQKLAKAIGRALTRQKLVDVDSATTDRTSFALEGLNLSLLFDPQVFDGVKQVRSHVLDRTFDTRDILEVDFGQRSGGSLTVFVNHWPSRLSGEGAQRRIAAAYYLRELLSEKLRYSRACLASAGIGQLGAPR